MPLGRENIEALLERIRLNEPRMTRFHTVGCNLDEIADLFLFSQQLRTELEARAMKRRTGHTLGVASCGCDQAMYMLTDFTAFFTWVLQRKEATHLEISGALEGNHLVDAWAVYRMLANENDDHDT